MFVTFSVAVGELWIGTRKEDNAMEIATLIRCSLITILTAVHFSIALRCGLCC